MAHFYSNIQGQAGDATRMGSKASGIAGWVQSWGARLSVSMNHRDIEDTDDAHFLLHAGPSNHNGGSLSMAFRDATTIVNALGTGDAKINAIRERIYKEIEKLNEEAPKAVKRAERRRKIEANRREREEKRMQQAKLDTIRDMQPEEKARIVHLVDEIELDAAGNFEDMKLVLDRNPRVIDGHTIITARKLGWLWDVDFDLTAGQWVLPHALDELDLGEVDMQGFGWRCVEKVTA